jgi:hypothetical protein
MSSNGVAVDNLVINGRKTKASEHRGIRHSLALVCAGKVSLTSAGDGENAAIVGFFRSAVFVLNSCWLAGIAATKCREQAHTMMLKPRVKENY